MSQTVRVYSTCVKELKYQTPFDLTKLLQNQIWSSKQINYASSETIYLYICKTDIYTVSNTPLTDSSIPVLKFLDMCTFKQTWFSNVNSITNVIMQRETNGRH